MKSQIMKKAWELYRTTENTFSECLKIAWRNAKAIIKCLENEIEECHTWYGWKMLGYMVKHESKNIGQCQVITEKGMRTLSFFNKSQVEVAEG